MKPVHTPMTGHDLMTIERYRDDTRHMVELLILKDCYPYYKAPRRPFV